MVKFKNQGQFWKAETVQISKLSLILKFEQDLMEKFKKNETINFFMDTVYILLKMSSYQKYINSTPCPKKMDPFVFHQFLYQIMLKFQNQGQF